MEVAAMVGFGFFYNVGVWTKWVRESRFGVGCVMIGLHDSECFLSGRSGSGGLFFFYGEVVAGVWGSCDVGCCRDQKEVHIASIVFRTEAESRVFVLIGIRNQKWCLFCLIL